MKYVVFLDTNIYDGANYSFHNTIFSRLKEYIGADRVSLQINSVIEGEVKEHISRDIGEALRKVNKSYKERSLALFRTLPNFSEHIVKIDIDSWIDRVHQEFHRYLEECHVNRIGVNGIDVEEIMRWYFQKKMPFEEKKPHEFKDAIAISSIVKEIIELSEDEIYCVISNDNGFRAAIKCILEETENHNTDRVLAFQRVEDFIGFIEAEDKYLIEFLKSDNAKYTIREAIIEAFEDIDICIDSIDPWLEEKEIVDICEIQYGSKLIKINGETSKATVLFDVTANVRLEYSYTDEDESFYDKEDRVYLWQTTIKKCEVYRISFQMVVLIDISNCIHPHQQGEELVIDNDACCYVDEVIESPSSIDVDETDCLESEVIRQDGPFHREEDESVRAYDVCPDCGCPIGIENDGGNGFCINCAPNH